MGELKTHSYHSVIYARTLGCIPGSSLHYRLLCRSELQHRGMVASERIIDLFICFLQFILGLRRTVLNEFLNSNGLLERSDSVQAGRRKGDLIRMQINYPRVTQWTHKVRT